MRVFKNKWFVKFAKKEVISDQKLLLAIADAKAGKIDADLGGGVIKQRIGREGEGKSGGYRTIILYRTEVRAFFVYGFAKSDLDNISKDDVKAFTKLAKIMLSVSEKEIETLLKANEISEVK